MNKIILLSVLAIVLIAGCTTPTPGTSGNGNIAGNTTQPTGGTGNQTPIGGNPTGASLKEFRVTIFHTGYSPNSFSVSMGDTVKFLAVTGPGTSSHNHGITIDAYGINKAVTTEDTNNPVVIQFLANQKGTFTIYCKTCWDGSFGTSHPAIQATLTVT